MSPIYDDGCSINKAGTDWADDPRGATDQCIRAPKWRVFPTEIDSDDQGDAYACDDHLGLAASLLHALHRSAPYLLVRPVPRALAASVPAPTPTVELACALCRVVGGHASYCVELLAEQSAAFLPAPTPETER